MDEVDTLCPKRQNSNNELEKRVVATLLTLMDDLSNVILISVFQLDNLTLEHNDFLLSYT